MSKISLPTMDYSWGQKIESAHKIHASRGWHKLHLNQFWWAWPFQFQSYGSFSILAKFPFQTMDYSPWGSRKWNWLKVLMHIEVDVIFMQTNIGGRGLSGFRVMAPFCLPSKTAKFSLQTMDHVVKK